MEYTEIKHMMVTMMMLDQAKLHKVYLPISLEKGHILIGSQLSHKILI